MKNKELLLIILLFSVISAKSQYISADQIREITDLYKSEQYAPFNQKLNSIDFKLTERVDDYILNNIKHRSELEFERKSKAPYNKHLTEFGNAENYETSTWNFEIEETSIYFKLKSRLLLYSPDAKNIFDQYCSKLVTIDKAVEYPYDGSSDFLKKFVSPGDNVGIDPESGKIKYLDWRINIDISYYHESKWTDSKKIVIWMEFCEPKHPLRVSVDQHLKDQEKLRSESIITIPVQQVGKISKVLVSISGKQSQYIIDSGASDMNINKSMETYLKEIGAIRGTDYLKSGQYQLADGSIKEYPRVLLHSVKVGEITLNSIEANITNDNEPLLLGKSFFNRFSFWKINNEKQTLELKKRN